MKHRTKDLRKKRPSVLERLMPKREKKKGTPPSSYETMPHYFPTEQVDIVKKTKLGRRRKKRWGPGYGWCVF